MALSNKEIREVFGAFDFCEAGGGMVAPAREWLARNIATVEAPFWLQTAWGRTRRVRCHRLVAGFIEAALEELVARGLQRLIYSYDGCFVPRHICWQESRGLSRHAWGVALDLNAAEFPFGSTKLQDARLVEVFARQGFLCGQSGGGLWRKTCDPMHFEFAELARLKDADEIGEVRIEIDGAERPLAGKLEAGRVWGPVREIVEALGARVEWNSGERAAKIRKVD